MRATIALRDIVSKAENRFVIALVPLHRHLHAHGGVLVALLFPYAVKNIWVQDFFALVDEFHKAFHTTSESEVVFFVLTLVYQANLDTIV